MLKSNLITRSLRLARHLCSSTPLVYLLASERSERDTLRGNTIEISLYLASERSELDTLRGNAIEISLYLFIYLFASERSERDTYSGNTIENRGCLFIYLLIYMDVRMSFCTLPLRILVFAPRSTPPQTSLN